jgi:peptidoglycan/LPS O-acetylase OafA/YrhL
VSELETVDPSAPDLRPARLPRRWRLPTLDARFDGRTNAIGLLRHVLAFAVLAAHSWQVGFNAPNPTLLWWHGQTQLGSMGVFGFFVLSGFLITASAQRVSVGRYAWHRFLRIYPALWACLACCAFLIAPVVAKAHGMGLRAFWYTGDGPAQYVTRNFFASMEQGTIAGLFADVPYAGGHPTTVNAPTWSLKYELVCYVGVGLLAALAVLRRAKFVAPLLLCLVWAALLDHELHGPALSWAPRFTDIIGPVPFLGLFDVQDFVILAFLFLVGMVARLYRRWIPMHGSLAVVAAGALAASLWYGGFLVYGMVAYGYLLLYAAVALPKAWSFIGRKWDYSYGIYIYGYPIQLVLAVAGVQRIGLVGYTVAATLVTLVFAAASWHLVEKRALSLKDARFVGRDPGPARAEPPAVPDPPQPADRPQPVAAAAG